MAGTVSEAVIRRLPGYYRHLRELEKEGVRQISSQELGRRMRLTASQIRQDINCFGGFGRQGFGYGVPELRESIGHILGLDQPHRMIIVGAGNIGRAVASYNFFGESGFEIAAVFDSDPDKIGAGIGAVTVRDMRSIQRYIADNKVDICVLAVPSEVAQALAEELCEYGVSAFWNFAPVDLKLPKETALVNVHLEEGLQILSFRMLSGMRGNGW
ncbi:MAG: redox-sensing transcriptional repressor Rex [Clostridia bacterium]|nr:redox-sensing transcriptional repressor Rex [Clostridia bacterium]